MGNQVGKGANRMAIAAMSNVTHVEKRDISTLLLKFRDAAMRDGDPLMITRTEFYQCLSAAQVHQNDIDIFDRLFTMFDKTGDDAVNFKDFIVGIAPLITGTHVDKIDFALHLFDIENSGYLRAVDIVRVLCQMNRVASYFGDPVMAEDQITALVCDVLAVNANERDALNVQVSYYDYIRSISEHPTVTSFINGGGGVYYGQKTA